MKGNFMNRRLISQDDMKIQSQPLKDEEYKDGVICKCGTIVIFRGRNRFEPVLVQCPKCGYEILYG